jgi:hypothetical protein
MNRTFFSESEDALVQAVLETTAQICGSLTLAASEMHQPMALVLSDL